MTNLIVAVIPDGSAPEWYRERVRKEMEI